MNFFMWLVGHSFVCIFAGTIGLGFLGYFISTLMVKAIRE